MTAKGIPIPDHLVAFLHGPVLMELASRDARLRAIVVRISGAAADGPNGVVTVLVPEIAAGPTLANLEDNGAAAFAFGEPVSHETYQMKGRYLGHRPAAGAEAAIPDLYIDKIVNHLCIDMKMYPEAAFRRWVLDPSVAIRIAVDAIYLQTPGPDAGKLIAGGGA